MLIKAPDRISIMKAPDYLWTRIQACVRHPEPVAKPHRELQWRPLMARIDSLQSNLQRQVVHNLLAQKTYLDKNQQPLFFALILHSCVTNSITCINQEPGTNPKE